MPSPPLTSRELVDRLDARHDELIARLDELNAQIEAALAEFGRAREASAAAEQQQKTSPRRLKRTQTWRLSRRRKKEGQGPTEVAFPVPVCSALFSRCVSGRTPHRSPHR